jgi:hypothetical protein
MYPTFGTGDQQVRPRCQRPREPRLAVEPCEDGTQISPERDRRIRLETDQRLQLEHEDVDPALQDPAGGIETTHFDEHQVLFERWHGPSADPLLDEVERLAVHLQKLLSEAEIAPGGQHFPGLHAHLRPELTLALDHLGFLHVELALGDPDTPCFPAVQVERQRHAHHDVVVRTSDALLGAEVEHGIRAERRLAKPPPCCVHFGACGTQLQIVPLRPRDQFVNREFPHRAMHVSRAVSRRRSAQQ